MTQLHLNLRILVTLVVFLTLIITAIILVAEYLLRGLPMSPSVFQTIGAMFLRIGIIITVVTGIITLIYTRLWNWGPVASALQIPDYSGRWEGWYYRGISNEILESAQEMRQNGLVVSAVSFGPFNESRSITSVFRTISASAVPELIWTYDTKRKSLPADPGGNHCGTHVMRLIIRGGEKYLEGEYYNDRLLDDGRRGAAGIICLKYASHKLLNELAYSNHRWAMQDKPEKLKREKWEYEQRRG
jgi:SMODS-associating 2TM, beta-strand rich effector domain